GCGLDAADLLTDLAGSFRRLLGKSLDFGGDDGKASAGGTRARGLNGGIERQQVGLARDRVDQLNHVADPRSGSRQFADLSGSVARLAYRLTRDSRRLLH